MRNLAPPHRPLLPRGFTLLEVMLAVSMFALLVGGLVVVFHGTIRLRENTTERIDNERPFFRIYKAIKSDLQGIVSPSEEGLAGEFYAEQDSDGNARSDEVEFYTVSGTVSDAYPWGNTMKVEYWLQPSEDGDDMDLMRGVTRNLLATMEEEPEEEILVTGVESFECSYYIAEDDTWEDSWDTEAEEGAMPNAIRVRIAFAPWVTSKGDEVWPSDMAIVVPIEIAPLPTMESKEEGDGQEAPGGGMSGGGGGGAPGGGGGGGGAPR